MSEQQVGGTGKPSETGNSRWFAWLGVSVLVVAIDQLTKWYVTVTLTYGERVEVLPIFSWVRWHNDGAAFSILAGSGGWQRWFFVALAAAFTIFIVYELRKLPVGDRLMGFVYSLILGGALGNGIDRLLHGYVVDFIRFHYDRWGFPAFNVADIALFIGASLWILLLFLEFLRERRERAASG